MRLVLSAMVRDEIAQMPHTASALARMTSRTQATAEPINSPHDTVCSIGKRHANKATAPAASNAPACGSHLGSGCGAETPARWKAFMF